MEKLQEHFEKISTGQLEKLLADDCAGRSELPTDTILLICAILAERRRSERTAEDAFRTFKEHYRTVE